jgi:lipoprotein signal peptidase
MKTYRVVLWALALAGVCADQATKYSVFAALTGAADHRYWLFQADAQHGFALETRYISLGADGSYVPHVNQGALFGIGIDYAAYANGFFAVISIAAAAAILYWSFRPTAARDPWVCAALGLILAGTLGNLYDRLVFTGVRDFLHWNYLFDWPVFNVADSCLVCGACLLLLQAFVRQSAAKAEKAAAAAASRGAPAHAAPASCVGAAPSSKA